MIIDCHGHYTTAPGPHTDWRASQLAAFREGRPAPAYPAIPEGNELAGAPVGVRRRGGRVVPVAVDDHSGNPW